jgi:hypothetical protein
MSARTAWGQMIARCYDPNHEKYHRYGARGIRVCDRWICFRLFLEDMGERPKDKTLNRIDNDGDYRPDNCEWATHKEQAQNRGNNKLLTFEGKTLCLTEWAREIGITREALRNRINKGWSVDDALTTPQRVKK